MHRTHWTNKVKTREMLRPVKHGAENTRFEAAAFIRLLVGFTIEIWPLRFLRTSTGPNFSFGDLGFGGCHRSRVRFIGKSLIQVGPELLSLPRFVRKLNIRFIFCDRRGFLLHCCELLYTPTFLRGADHIWALAVRSAQPCGIKSVLAMEKIDVFV